MANRLQLAVEVTEDPKGFTGSIQQVENLEDRVKALTRDTVELRKQKEAVTAQLRAFDQQMAAGASLTQAQAKQVEGLTLREKELANSLGRSEFAQRTARQELRNLNFASSDARMEAQLLAAQFGIHLPAGIDRLVTRIPGVQRAISAAFVIAPVVALGVAIIALLPKVREWADSIMGMTPALKEQLEHIREMNLILAGRPETGTAVLEKTNTLMQERNALERERATILSRLQAGEISTEQGEAAAKRTKERIAAIGKEIQALEIETGKFQKAATAQAEEFKRQTALVGLGEIEKLRQQLAFDLEKMPNVPGAFGEARAARIALAEKQVAEARRQAAEKEQQEIAQLVKAAESQQKQGLAGLFGKPEQLRAGLGIEPAKGLAFDLDELHKRVKAHEEALADIQELEERAGIARLDPTRKAIAQINIEERKRIAEFQKLLKEGTIIEQQFQDARVAITIEAEAQRMEVMKAAAEEQRRAIEQYGNDLEGLFDRTIGSARSAKEAIANIWRELANEWKHQIFQRIAQATFPGGGGGGQQRQAATSGALGAILGPLGGILGGSATAPGPGGTPPFFPETATAPLQSRLGFASSAFARTGDFATAGTLGTLGIGGGAGAATAAQTPATVAASMGLPATTPIGDLLGKLGPNAGPIGAYVLTAVSLLASQSKIQRGIGGGMLLGPIGALLGIFLGGGKQKRQDTAIENAGFAGIKQLLEDYERHRRDYGDTIDSMNRTWEQMAGQFVRSESKRDAKRNFDLYISRIQDIEDERNRRRQLMALLPVPSFAEGGLVSEPGAPATGGFRTTTPLRSWLGFAHGGPVPAILHQGEYVMTQKAVQRWGTSLLEGLNRGTEPRAEASGGGYSLTVWVPSKEFAAQIVEEGVPVVIAKGGKASRMLRG